MFLFTASPVAAEVVARSGLDWVLIDLEHGTANESDLIPQIMAIAGAGAAPLVRVETGERIRIGRALDRGARGVMVPQVPSADIARTVVRRMRTQPSGERGVALFNRGMRYGERGHEGAANMHEELLTIVQIESVAAVAEVEEIAGVDGVDVLFVGPADLSHALGVPGDIQHPDFDAAITRVAEAAKAAGKAAGVLTWNPEDVGRYAAKGFTFFGLASELNILDRAARLALDSARSAALAATTPEVV
jgi:2-dehydro-3-deoxyglucarate aldolase/4-hydroxy-2-oxoheptanedioate aldolase